jgi:hypothetical protein
VLTRRNSPVEFTTPQVLLQRYEVPMAMAVGSNAKNSQSVAEFLGQYFSSTDLTGFTSAMSVVPATVVITGPNDPTKPGGEASLDIQCMLQTTTTHD